jgi:hypothetical protein
MAARKKTQTPEPIAVSTICSVCGLSWHDHGKDPTTDDCIRLLKAELAKRPITVPVPQPYPVPYRPYTRPWYWEEWYSKTPRLPGEITWSSSASKETNFGGKTFTEHTPRLLSTTCQATSASTL